VFRLNEYNRALETACRLRRSSAKAQQACNAISPDRYRGPAQQKAPDDAHN